MNIDKRKVSDPPAQRHIGKPLSLFWPNVVLMVIVGVAVSMWLIYYTSIFPEVAGLAALGGAFVWLGVVWKFLSDRRKNELLTWSEINVFAGAHTLVCASLLGLLLVLVGNFLGGIQLEPFQESSEHTVYIVAPRNGSSGPLRLVPSGELRWIGWTSWWSRTRVTIKVSGYPAKVVDIWPWRREGVYVPSSLVRPVVLLHPSVALMDAVRGTSMTLELIVTDANHEVEHEASSFDGHSIWIGGDQDIQVPAATETRWRDQLKSLNSINHLSFLLPPLAPPQFGGILQAGHNITLVLHTSDRRAYESVSFRVQPPRSNHEFVQEVELDVPVDTE